MTSYTDGYAIIFYFGAISLAFCLLAFLFEVVAKEMERRERRRAREWRRYMQRVGR